VTVSDIHADSNGVKKASTQQCEEGGVDEEIQPEEKPPFAESG